MKQKITLVILVVAALVVASCRSSKKVTEQQTTSELKNAVDKVNFNRQSAKGVKAKMNLKVEAGVSNVSAGGNLRMKRNEIIQLSVMFMGFVEAGRLELTPDYLLVQDRIGHRYVQTRWKDIKVLEQAGINFYTFQALFWEELFVPGRTATPAISDFDVDDLGSTVRLTVNERATDKRTVAVNFVANAINGLIQHTNVTPTQTSSLSFDWKYSKWASLDGKDFPEQMFITVKSGSKTYAATLNLSHIESEPNMKDIRTKIADKRYKKVSLESIITYLMSGR